MMFTCNRCGIAINRGSKKNNECAAGMVVFACGAHGNCKGCGEGEVEHYKPCDDKRCVPRYEPNCCNCSWGGHNLNETTMINYTKSACRHCKARWEGGTTVKKEDAREDMAATRYNVPKTNKRAILAKIAA